jgi:hypothetical protein
MQRCAAARTSFTSSAMVGAGSGSCVGAARVGEAPTVKGGRAAGRWRLCARVERWRWCRRCAAGNRRADGLRDRSRAASLLALRGHGPHLDDRRETGCTP